MKELDYSQRFGFGQPRSVDLIRHIFIHTTENAPGTPAENVAQYQINSQSGSYHYLADRTKILRENTDDWMAWAVGNKGNTTGLHLSFVARAAMTRADWLNEMAMLTNGATVVARWVKRYNIPLEWLTPNQLRANAKGLGTHDTARQAWGITDHTDPGPGFPKDIFVQLVRKQLGSPAQKTKENTMSNTDRLLDEIKQQNTEILNQLGYANKRWGIHPQNGGRSLNDTVAAIAAKLGIPGTKDIKG